MGDHVAVSFIPSCGTCFWCASGRQNLCDLGMMTLAGGMISDGTYRYHLDGENLNRMAQLGTFADEMVCHENSVVRINAVGQHEGRRAHQLRHRHRLRLRRRPGQGQAGRDGRRGRAAAGSARVRSRARASPARAHIIAVDPVPFKLEKAKEIGATHTAASLAEVPFMLPELTHGSQRRRRDPHARACCTGEMIAEACALRLEGRPHRGDGHLAVRQPWTCS